MLDMDNKPKLVREAAGDSSNSLLVFPNGDVAIYYKDEERVVKAMEEDVRLGILIYLYEN